MSGRLLVRSHVSEMLGSNPRHAMWPDRKGEPMAATVVVSCPGSGRIGSN